MDTMKPGEWKELLTMVLSLRLETNAVESALKDAGILSGGQIQEIRKQASNTAKAWSAREDDDVLRLLRVHSSPGATMGVPRA